CPSCGREIPAGERCPACAVLSDTSTFGLAVNAAAHAVAATGAARSRIGNYQLLRILGEGGMGIVYEAEQQYPRRTVALKVIKPGWTTPNSLRRFEQEAQALGRLQHPGIAQIYEAGMTDTG